MTTNYGKRDSVIVVFNTNNVSNNKMLNKALKNLLPSEKFTNNVIIVGNRNKRIDYS